MHGFGLVALLIAAAIASSFLGAHQIRRSVPRQEIPGVIAMRVKTVAVEFGFTLNCGNYQSAKATVQTWAEVEEGESEEVVIDYLFQICKQKVREHLPKKPSSSDQATLS
jgi:hypothetical protein